MFPQRKYTRAKQQSSLIVRAQALSERQCGVSQILWHRKLLQTNMTYLWRHWGGGSSRRDNSGLGLDRWLMWWGQYLNIIECCRYHLGDRTVAGGGVIGQGSWGSLDEWSPRTTESPACNWGDSTPRQLASSREEQLTRFFMKIWGTQVGNQWWHGSHYSPKRWMQRGNSGLVRGGTRTRSGPSICSVIRRYGGQGQKLEGGYIGVCLGLIGLTLPTLSVTTTIQRSWCGGLGYQLVARRSQGGLDQMRQWTLRILLGQCVMLGCPSF